MSAQIFGLCPMSWRHITNFGPSLGYRDRGAPMVVDLPRLLRPSRISRPPSTGFISIRSRNLGTCRYVFDDHRRDKTRHGLDETAFTAAAYRKRRFSSHFSTSRGKSLQPFPSLIARSSPERIAA
ncbi:MAG: hypothetical protein R3F35_02420 [Myxococcota bacterium]